MQSQNMHISKNSAHIQINFLIRGRIIMVYMEKWRNASQHLDAL